MVLVIAFPWLSGYTCVANDKKEADRLWQRRKIYAPRFLWSSTPKYAVSGSSGNTSQYITELLMEYYEMKENGGKTTMANNGSRTMAFQIPEELFQRIKQHLERESARSGRKVTQREFVLSLIEEALEQAEEEAAEKEATQEKCGEDA